MAGAGTGTGTSTDTGTDTGERLLVVARATYDSHEGDTVHCTSVNTKQCNGGSVIM